MNTTVWLIRFTGSDGKPAQVVHAHNCIADYRQLDPSATAKVIDCAAVAELIEAQKATRRELHACQAVIHLAGGFDPAYVTGAQAAIKQADAALANVGAKS